jgi:hypothetical protein
MLPKTRRWYSITLMMAHSRSQKSSTPLVVMVGVLLAATALRLYHIDFRALWFDEGVSVTFAHLPLREVMPNTALWEEVNPPLYRQILGLWTVLVGTSAFTVRWFSGWLGILAVALTYRLGHKLGFGERAALGGAALVTLAPMQVYYSQEAKGYTFIQACILVTVWLWLSFSNRKHPPGWYWASIWMALALALGSHATIWLMLGTMTLWTILWARKRWLGWSLVVGTLGLLWAIWFIPVSETILRGAATAAATSDMLGPRGPLAYLSQMAGEFAAGPEEPAWIPWALGSIALLLGAWGLWKGQAPRRSKWLLATWAIVPVLLGLGIQTVVFFMLPRFFLYVTPALWLPAALGLERLPRRWLAAVGAGVLALLMASQLAGHYVRPSDPTTDYRPLAADLAQRIRPQDALIYSYSWQPGFLDAYLPDNLLPTYYLSFFPPETIDEELGSILRRHGRVWLVTYQLGAEDPIHAAGQWLLAHAAAPTSAWYGDGQVSLFLGPEAVLNPGLPSATANFDGGRIALTYAPIAARAAPGEPIGVALTWEAHEPIPERYVVFLHLLAAESSEPLAQQDSQPVNNLRPSYTWTPGESIQDYRALWLPTSLPQGEPLRLVVGLYDGDTLARVPVDGDGDDVLIGTIVIDPSAPQW